MEPPAPSNLSPAPMFKPTVAVVSPLVPRRPGRLRFQSRCGDGVPHARQGKAGRRSGAGALGQAGRVLPGPAAPGPGPQAALPPGPDAVA